MSPVTFRVSYKHPLHRDNLIDRTLQDAICHFAPQFRGSDQHDSQEFLVFLLDGLHEDLNLVINKPAPVPMTPERESELEVLPLHVASQREWEIYIQRDNSVIVAWFQGQERSRLQCMTCGKVSSPSFLTQYHLPIVNTDFNHLQYLHVPIFTPTN